MNGTIDLIVTRYAQRDETPVIQGSPEDKLIDLSEMGREKAQQQGLSIISPKIKIVDGTYSDFRRTKTHFEEMIAGAKSHTDYSNPTIHQTERTDIGLGGINWEDPHLPQEGTTANHMNHAVRELLRKHYFPTEEHFPIMAGYAYTMLDAAINGIEKVKKEITSKEEKGLVVIITHRPIIDAFRAAVYNTVRIDGNKVNTHEFPGHIARGESIEARSYDLADNPRFIFFSRDERKIHSLDGLKRLRDTVYEHSQRKI